VSQVTAMSHAYLLSASVAPSGLGLASRHMRPRARSQASVRRRGAVISASSSEDDSKSSNQGGDPLQESEVSDNVPSKQKGLGKGVNLFDPAATASRFITRRFGFTGGLVFVGLLASVEGREIVGALLERDTDIVDGEVVKTDSGLAFVEMRVGGGVSAKKGDFVGVHLLIEDKENQGTVYLDTKSNKKPIAFIFQKRPLLAPVCEGIEEAVGSMRRGGIRRVTIPSALAYGANGAVLANGKNVPPNRDVMVTISIEDISPSYL